MTSADCHDEASARSHCGPGVGGDGCSRLLGDCIGIGKDFNLHCVSCFPGKLVARQKCEQQVPRGLESPLVMTRIKGLLRRS
jgi:hypothetical protein